MSIYVRQFQTQSGSIEVIFDRTNKKQNQFDLSNYAKVSFTLVSEIARDILVPLFNNYGNKKESTLSSNNNCALIEVIEEITVDESSEEPSVSLSTTALFEQFFSNGLFTNESDIRIKMGDEFADTIDAIVNNQNVLNDDDPMIDKLAKILAKENLD